MSDYEKLTVVEIRALFKSRGISATGLTRKQQLIDRLREVDAAAPGQNGRENAKEEPSIEAPIAPAEETIQDAAHANEPQETPQALADTEKLAAQASAGTTDATTLGISTSGIEDIAMTAQGDALPVDEGSTQTAAVLTLLDTTQEASPNAAQSSDPPAEQSKETPSGPKLAPSVTVLAEPEDSRKRKRRSMSPDVQEEDVAQKRRKSSEGEQEDGVNAQSGNTTIPKAQQVSDVAMEDAPLEKGTQDVVHEGDDKAAAQDSTKPSSDGQLNVPVKSHSSQSPSRAPRMQPKSPKEARYKDILSPPVPSLDGPSDQPSDDRVITPSLHHATAAIYIRNLKRPLQPSALQSHLEALVQPPNAASSTATILAFHIDTLRTHALVLFSTTAAAARARSALHAAIWPPEATREPLWVDFVPDESIQSWIEQERSSSGGGRGAGAKRWEVIYDNGEAQLQEVSSNTLPPTGPRASFAQPHAPPPRVPTPEVHRAVPSTEAAKPAPFLALDNLFKCTTAKPKLYFLPVAADFADKRLDELDARTTRRGEIPPGGSGYRDSRRYTFEDGGLVDGGPEFGLRIERGGRSAMRGGRGGRRGEGGWRGR